MNIRKYTPLLFRCLVLTLAFCFLFSVFSPPLQVKAASPVFGFALRSIAGTLFASCADEFCKLSAENLASFSSAIYGYLSAPVVEYLSNQETFNNSLAGENKNMKLTLSSTYIDEILYLLFNTTIMAQFRLSKSKLQEQDLSVLEDGVEIYIPSEEALQYPELITQEQVLATGDFIEVLVANNVLLTQIKLQLESLPSDISETLSSKMDHLTSELRFWTGSVNDTISSFQRSMVTWLGDLNSTITKWGRDSVEWSKTINSNLAHYSNKIITSVDGVAKKLDSLIEVFPALSQQLDEIVEKIPAYVEGEIVAKPAIDVQVGAQTIVVSDYSSLNNAFRMKLSWIGEIFNFLRELFSRIVYTGEPPKVKVPLTKSTGLVKFNSDVYVVDMTWYESYKPYVDTIISGFLWLGFGWNIYKRTPGILNGIGISQEPSADGSLGKRGKTP